VKPLVSDESARQATNISRPCGRSLGAGRSAVRSQGGRAFVRVVAARFAPLSGRWSARATQTRRGRTGEAETQFRQALNSNLDDARAHNNLGISLAFQGRLTEALDQFAEAVRLQPVSSARAKTLETVSARLRDPGPVRLGAANLARRR